MSTVRSALLKKELEKRAAAAAAPKFSLNSFFFPKQMEFFRGSKNRFKVAVCSRRAGKTCGIVGDAVDLCLAEAGVRVLYVTLTRENCIEIIWPDLLALLEREKIECKINHQRLTVTFANKSYLSCAGAKDKREIGKFRGRKLRRIYIDEAQNFPDYLKNMIEEDLMPTLRDLRGEMYVTGTPGPLKRGFFYKISNDGLWESHNWTAFENPHLHDPENGKNYEITLEEERQVRGIDRSDPSYVRETYGIWTEDIDSLVFKFKAERNVVDVVPDKLTYIFGIDLGYNDADAIAVLGYNNVDGNVYLVEELVTAKQGITPLVEQITKLAHKYQPVKMVMDAGGLGKKIQEEIRPRFSINLEAADKNRKFEFIELLNDDLRTGKFKALPKSRFEDDCYLVQWDRKSDDPTKLAISKSFHSDICDSVLYSWRECRHYFKQPIEVKAHPNSDAYMAELEAKEAEAMELRKFGGDGLDSGVQSWGDLGVSDDFDSDNT
jgi:PBSX family phage terminase large subunit